MEREWSFETFIHPSERAMCAPAEPLVERLPTARGWFLFAVLSLVLAGLTSLVLVAGRTPALQHLVTDPHFARKCLVIHVNLALTVWFFGFFCALFSLLPGRSQGYQGLFFAIFGVVLFTASGGVGGAVPLLSNYIPVLDHPLFHAGILIFLTGVGMSLFFQVPWWDEGARSPLPATCGIGLRAGVIAFAFALFSFVFALWLNPTVSLSAQTYYDRLFWGAGHIFQFVHVAGMTACWFYLLRVGGIEPFGVRGAILFYGVLLFPLVLTPFFFSEGTLSRLYHNGFTHLMRWGIWPPVVVFLIHAFSRLAVDPRAILRQPAVGGFLASAFLTLIGFLIGGMISVSSTLIPAHYHASIGAVTTAYMATSYQLLPHFGYPIRGLWFSRFTFIQPWLFGFGQFIFALGFGISGMYGMGRKIYGSEQAIQHPLQKVGLTIMAVGGIMAVAGGILYLVIVIRAWLQSSNFFNYKNNEIIEETNHG